MAIQFNEDSLESILAEVDQIAVPVIKSERQRLAKAAGEEAPPEESGESSPPPEASPEPSPEGSAPPSGPEGSPEGSAPPPGPEGSPEGGPPADDGFPQDPAQLQQMIAQLPREQQEPLYLACKQVLSASPPAGPEASPGGAPPPGPEMSAGGPPPPAPPPGPPAMKKEMQSSPGNGGKSAPIKKNEDDMASNKEVAELKAELAELKKGQSLTIAGLSRLAGVPMRKSLQGISQMADVKTPEEEPQNLSKSEIKERISEKIQAGKLTKKDKAAVLDFWESGARDQSQIAHLLKDE